MARLEIKISDEEKKELLLKAESLDISMSELIRKSAKRINAFSPENKKLALAKNRELNRIGINLNQIARWANTHKSKADRFVVVAHLLAIQELLEEL